MYNMNAKANSRGIRKGSWTDEEDHLLRKCIEAHGEGNWHRVPHRAGLNRCRKSCRLRWMNYLKPNIKRGQFNEDEVDLIIRLHKLLGNRWSLIAGRIPGRTANDVKNYWNTHLHKKLLPSPLPPKHPNTLTANIYGKNSNSLNDNRKKQHIVSSITSKNITSNIPMHPQVIKPQPWTFPKTSSSSSSSSTMTDKPSPAPNKEATDTSLSRNPLEEDDENDNDASTKWWENMVEMYEKEENGPRDGFGYPEPMYMSESNIWPISSNEMHRSSSNYVQEHDIWEDDDLWNFDANVWQ